MKVLCALLSRSIGKKQFVALTGLLLIGFLASHLAGNLLMYQGSEAFDSYADYIIKHPLLIPAEIGLALLFVGHIVMGIKVSLENRAARPERYAVDASEGGRTIGSSTMKYTGLMTLVFLCVHIFTFRIQHPAEGSLFDWVMYHFERPWYMGFYVLAMVFLGAHLSHGVQSAFQTFGFNHPRYTPLVKKVSIALAVLFAVGFGSLPLWGFLRGAQ